MRPCREFPHVDPAQNENGASTLGAFLCRVVNGTVYETIYNGELVGG
jgi:hypothetical protein